MTKLNVNIGLSVNDKTGDTLRTAFDKINQNFTELYPQVVPTTSKGKANDIAGMTAFDATYFYYCTASYTTGSADIWKRTAHNAGTW